MMETLQTWAQQAQASGSITLYLFLLLGGLLASISPCVYPVLPLTVGYIGANSGGRRWKGFFLSVTLVLGMALVYSIAGVAMAAAGRQFGQLWANGWIVYAMAWFFLLMGLLMLDVYSVPSFGFLQNFRARHGGGKGYVGAFVTGAVSGLAVGPCTAPIMGLVAAAVARNAQTQGGLAYAGTLAAGGLQFFLFALAQGALILLCGTFSGLLTRLPKSGRWMVVIKKVFALLIIAGASILFVHAGQSGLPRVSDVLAAFESGGETESAAGREGGASPADATPGRDSATDEGRSRFGGEDFLEE